MEHPKPASRFQQSLALLVCFLGILALAIAGYRTVIVSLADAHFRRGDLSGIESAERIVPSNARYHFARALTLQEADPTSPEVVRELSQAVALNPRFSDAMLSWSVDREFSGDKRGAEQLLLEARRVDQLLRPSWALANFYYRQGNAEKFWPQARECLRIIGVAGYTTGRYDPMPIFRLCWSMQPDAAAILSKAIPPNRGIEQGYLLFLMGTPRLDAQIALVDRILPRSGADDLWVLIPHINRLIAAARIETAVQEWNALVDRKVLPYAELNPAAGSSLTNASFRVAPLGAGFDWHPLYPESIRFTFLESEHTYRFDFDGAEPQQLGLIGQTLPLLPNRTYRFTTSYHASFDPAESGLTWVVTVNHNPVPTRVVEKSGTDDKTAVLEFQTPADTVTADLSLSYTRQPGTTLIRGPFDLLQTSLKLM